jgi:hypothetical protein
MVRPSLPERLAYLRPFIDELVSRDEHAIDESIDNTALLVALQKRISSLTAAEGVETLIGDRFELERWLVHQPDHPAQFIAAFLGEPADLAEYLRPFEAPRDWRPPPRRKPRPQRLISMELPPGFSFRREGSGFFLQSGTAIGSRHTVGVTFDKGPSIKQLKALSQSDAAVSFEDISLGTLSGTRVRRNGTTVTILLNGGGVKYCVYLEGDSTLVEPFLQTLSVVEGEI